MSKQWRTHFSKTIGDGIAKKTFAISCSSYLSSVSRGRGDAGHSMKTAHSRPSAEGDL